MSIINIREKFSQRIVDSEKELIIAPSEIKCQKPTIVVEGPSEEKVGITEYVSNLPGFQGVIKQRFSDFNVHEVSIEHGVARLTCYDLPNESIPVDETPDKLLDEDTIGNLKSLIDGTLSSDTFSIDVSTIEKVRRTEIHKFIKHKFGSDLVSNTVEDGEKKLISVTRAKKGAKDNRYPGHLPKYLHFVMSKSNMDTSEAIQLISSKLRVRANLISIAGTKDKRANTSQWVSIKGMPASNVLKLNKSLRRIWLGNFVYRNNYLTLGHLKGNLFEIALRDINVTDDIIQQSMGKLKEDGFINYFGLQRFGNSLESPTHEIGKLLIKEEYRKAVELILKPRIETRYHDVQRAREIYLKTHHAGQAYAQIRSKNRTIEGKILLGLKTHGPNAFINALDTLPRNVRLLYLHAYQSYLWNKVVSRRIATHGLSVLIGDLVLANSIYENEQELFDSNNEEENGIKDEVESKPCPVKQITAEDLDNYTIFDILHPIPGIDSVYPDNEIKNWYREALAEDELEFESMNCHIRKFSLTGSYRKILLRPLNLTWRTVHYDHQDDDLILNDADILEGKIIEDKAGGKHKALIIIFELSRSSYATMALREVLRSDTSPTAQSAFNHVKREGEETELKTKKPRLEDSPISESMEV